MRGKVATDGVSRDLERHVAESRQEVHTSRSHGAGGREENYAKCTWSLGSACKREDPSVERPLK
eukprot:1515382-Pleurochrysis_carterae.AAC.1